jgi:hypothetical protein
MSEEKWKNGKMEEWVEAQYPTHHSIIPSFQGERKGRRMEGWKVG